MSYRGRFAPSPTGHVHIGNMRAAIYNWLFARHHGGAFLLRVEDTDLERSTPEAVATVLDAMAWLGLDTDEEPLYQSTRREAHLAAADELLANVACDVGVLWWGEPKSDHALWVNLPDDPSGFANRVWSSLRDLESRGARTIWIRQLPDASEWDALRLRLQGLSAG